MKARKLIIGNCDACPFMYGGNKCTKMENREIDNSPEIPEWCPLEPNN